VAQEPAAAPSSWTRFGLASDGISALFPVAPTEGSHRSDNDDIRYLVADLGEDGTYEIRRDRFRPASALGATPSSLITWLEGMVRRKDRSEPVRWNGLVGHSIEGADEKGRTFSARAFASGNDIYIVVARAPAKRFDRAATDRFFASLQVHPPLRLYASTEGHLSLLVPAQAHESERTNGSTEGFFRMFWMGAYNDLPQVIVTAGVLGDAMKALPSEEALQKIVVAMTSTRSPTSIQKLVPLDVRGAHGCEYTLRSQVGSASGKRTDLYLRGRIFFVADRFYMVTYAALDPDSVRADLATQILDSLRWATDP
jgi:hypothetical protein